jgi:hypothetical protein
MRFDYAYMGADPSAADNRWLREAMEERIPVIYFLGSSPGKYQPIIPAFVVGWESSPVRTRWIAWPLDPDDAIGLNQVARGQPGAWCACRR